MHGENRTRTVKSHNLVHWNGEVARTAETHTQAVPFRLSQQERINRQERAIWKKLRHKLGGKRLLFGKKLGTAADLFAAIDRNNDGEIDYMEFELALRRLGMGLSDQQVG